MKQNKPKLGVLISNLGTPDAPTSSALRRYLKEFLSDPRIDTGLPRALWWLILNGIILQIRPTKSARLYQKIWTSAGSPLLAISQQQQQQLQQHLSTALSDYDVTVVLGMRYGNPSIASALETLQQANIDKIIALPLYPQFASATTASTFDAIAYYYHQQRIIPSIQFIRDYHQNPAYIKALADSVRAHWQQNGQDDLLLMSFHGMPKRVIEDGDPYAQQCQTTSQLLAQALGLSANQWQLAYQSRFGREKWLKPYTEPTLRALGEQKTQQVAVICAGFSVDCLETLEEINQENRAVFLNAGGQTFHYIPALNTSDAHMQTLTQIIVDAL